MNIELRKISPNFHEILINDTTLLFSYNTLIAFKKIGIGTVCRKNIWGLTTGGHLNTIEPNNDKRIPHELFEKILESMEVTFDIKKLKKEDRMDIEKKISSMYFQ